MYSIKINAELLAELQDMDPWELARLGYDADSVTYAEMDPEEDRPESEWPTPEQMAEMAGCQLPF